MNRFSLSITLIIFQLAFSQLSFAEPEITSTAKPHTLFKDAMADLLGSRGKNKAPEKAFVKFQTLAQQGWKTAQHMLGNMYEKGEGTERDRVKAYLWYSLAARDNFSIAMKKRDDLRESLNQAQLQQAEQMMSKWK